MKTLVKRLVIAVLVVGVVGAAYAFTTRNGASKKNEVTYESGEVTREDVRSFVTATGIIEPHRIVDIKSNVAGRIDKLYVDLGATVRAGQPIMDIDPTDTRTAYDQAEADLRAAVARKQQAEFNHQQQILQVEARIASAEKALESAQARLTEARVNARVQPELTEASVAQSTASLTSAEKSLAQAKENKTMLQEQLAQLQSVTIPRNEESIRAALADAKANMGTLQAEYQRQRNLMGQGYVAKSDVEQAYARLASAQAAHRNAQERMRTLEDENELAIKEMKARIAASDAGIAEASARVAQAQAALTLAKKNAYLVEVREQETKAAAAAVNQARAELKSARAEKNQVDVRKREIAAAEAQIVRGRASVQQADINRGYTRITSPMDGVVIAKQLGVEQGTVIPSSRGSIGSTNYLMQVGDITKLWIKCNVDETDIGQVSEGQKVTVKVDAYPSRLIDGKVIRIDPQAIIEQNVTMIPVTVELAQPDPLFKPGMNATCEFVVDEVTNVLTVPNEALRETDGVFRVQKMEGGKPGEPIEVGVGLAGQDKTEVITDALQEGDQVLTRTIEPERPEANNPFASPFGRRDRNRGGAGGAGGAGGRGGAGGGGRGGGR
jgi:HlyD family secretion protein